MCAAQQAREHMIRQFLLARGIGALELERAIGHLLRIPTHEAVVAAAMTAGQAYPTIADGSPARKETLVAHRASLRLGGTRRRRRGRREASAGYLDGFETGGECVRRGGRR